LDAELRGAVPNGFKELTVGPGRRTTRDGG
jgi:hypothetical protein